MAKNKGFFYGMSPTLHIQDSTQHLPCDAPGFKSTRGFGRISILFSHHEAKVLHFSVQSGASMLISKETLLGSGTVQIVQASALNVVYLKIGSISHALMPRLRCWRIGQAFVFPVPTGGYWRLDLLGSCPDIVETLARVLAPVLLLQKSTLPFADQLLRSIDRSNRPLGSLGRTKSAPNVFSSPADFSQVSIQGLAATLNASAIISGLSQLPLNEHSSNERIVEPAQSRTELRARQANQHYTTNDDQNDSVPCMRFTPADIARVFENKDGVVRRVTPRSPTCVEDYALADPNLLTEGMPVGLAALFSSAPNTPSVIDKLNPFESCVEQKTTCKSTATENYKFGSEALKTESQIQGTADIERAFSLQFPQVVGGTKTSPCRPLAVPSLFETAMEEEDWNIVVDELDKKNKSIRDRLSQCQPSLQSHNQRSLRWEERCQSFTHGILWHVGDLVYAGAHALASLIISDVLNHPGIANADDLVKGYGTHGYRYNDPIQLRADSAVVDDALDAELEVMVEGEIGHLCVCLLRSAQSIGRGSRALGLRIVNSM